MSSYAREWVRSEWAPSASLFQGIMTYEYALSFDRYCRCLQLQGEVRANLIEDSSALTAKLAESMRARSPLEKEPLYALAARHLERCVQVLRDADVWTTELEQAAANLASRLAERI